MSMPSSRLEVATTAGSRPALSASSIWVRSCRDTEPWCARATSAGAHPPPRPFTAPASAMISAGGRLGPPCRAGAGSGPVPSCSSARSAASSLSRAHSRSASRRELAKTIVELWLWISSSTRSSTCGQIERRRAGSSGGGPPSAAPLELGSEPVPGTVKPSEVSRSAMSSTGTTICSSIRLLLGGCTIVTGWAPPRNVATSSGGRTVADSPIRWRSADLRG